MRKIITLVALLIISFSFSQVKLLSWNVENLGKSKSETNITFIANTLKDYDIIALQEVVAGDGGAQSVAKLADELNRKGSKWDYIISDPTSSSAYKTERYAFLWKTSKIKKIGEAWLEKKYNLEIDREPFYCTFQYSNKQFTLANFHAITKSKQPETEIKYFKFLPAQYPNLNLLFVGDFNCPQSHTVFNPLKKMGYNCAFINQKTSLKKECIENVCLASEFDNIWFNSAKISVANSKVIHFYNMFQTLKEAREISDHIPLTTEITIKYSLKEEKIMPFVETPPIKDVTFHKDTIREYEYRTGTSSDYQYNYDVFGVDEEGNKVLGNITVDGKYGNGIIINKNSKKINVDVEWVGHGKLKGIDSNSNEYQLEVNED